MDSLQGKVFSEHLGLINFNTPILPVTAFPESVCVPRFVMDHIPLMVLILTICSIYYSNYWHKHQYIVENLHYPTASLPYNLHFVLLRDLLINFKSII